MDKEKQGKHRRSLVIMVSIAFAMFGFCYLLVPMYNALCKQFGINGKTAGKVVYDEQHAFIDKSRTVTVEFMTSKNASMPWDFYPLVRKVELHPGEMKRVAFYAKNTTDHDMTVQAIPSVSPGLAARYLKKTECFCFTHQTLAAHESRDMPLYFHLDPEIPKDVNTVSLAYTLFDVSGAPTRKTNKEPGRIN